MPISIYNGAVARQATTADAFNAIADSGRRRILDVLRAGDRSVSEIVAMVGSTQPQVSRHLGVLRAVEAVTVRTDGRRRVYSLNPTGLRPIHEWIGAYRAVWSDRLDDVLNSLPDDGGPDDRR